ncbi:hypothetical protein BDZ89DRAFT_1137699 [Hymenopellis radicata]|nr:hypothetical protein BDZ89DRAFT_1141422 [Hymenopellis radicata]KAF9021870.1 hypothetical protein BDZ89DRAFT_1137699 [Hymenopellis radicata]
MSLRRSTRSTFSLRDRSLLSVIRECEQAQRAVQLENQLHHTMQRVKRVQKALRCSLCSKTYLAAIIAQCGHSYCNGCFERLSKAHITHYRKTPKNKRLPTECPFCGEFLVDGVVTNHLVGQLIAELKPTR